jgi:hypothetical protein
MLLIPVIIFLCILAYKTKPEEESFKKYFENLFKIMEFHANHPQPRPSQEIIKEIKNTDGTFVTVKTSRSRTLFGWFEDKIQDYTLNLITTIIKHKVGSTTLHYDLGLFRVAYLTLQDKSDRFLGIYGTWIPLPF